MNTQYCRHLLTLQVQIPNMFMWLSIMLRRSGAQQYADGGMGRFWLFNSNLVCADHLCVSPST